MVIKTYPVKRRQTLLGSNLPRDNRMQAALNHTAGGDGLLPFPPLLYDSNHSAYALKTQFEERSDSFYSRLYIVADSG